MKNRTSRIAQASIVFCFVFLSPMAMAGPPTCPCDMGLSMETWEGYWDDVSLQSCEVTLRHREGAAPVKVARAGYLVDGEPLDKEFVIAAYNNAVCWDKDYPGHLPAIEIQEYKACADDFIAECASRLD